MDIADAERAIWSAWRLRHGHVRRVHRRQLKDHAAEVIGALRLAEGRQEIDADTAEVFEDLAKMLLKIAERYAEGRTGALLDPEDLAGAPKAVNREWIRLAGLGGTVAGTAVGASLLGLPDSTTTVLVGVATLVAVGLFYGAKFLPTDLVDIAMGQSRR
ncbi:hypothetical protein [Streptomyces silaceus]|uniref:hypothetical protein n=1 Tax=Streptomyces silaceus TaxID=545123 RepID=UPI0012FEB5E7|nr:hypothetical protein [Streptomyces silaceus]